MDERRPQRRRELSPKEKKALEKQHKKEQELNRKFDKQAAKYREEARKQARKAEDAHNKAKRPQPRRDDRAVDYSRMSEAERRRNASKDRNVRVQHIEVEGERRTEGARRRSDIMRETDAKNRNKRKKSDNRPNKSRRPETEKERNARPKDSKRRVKKTLPDIIEKETDKRVRNLEATDHKDGYYADEVAVRKDEAKKQRRERRKKMPKPISPAKRRARRITAYVSIIAIVIIVGVVLSLTVLFKTENIYVKGNKYYANDTIIRLAKVSEGDNIFISSMFGDKKAIEEKLPYVKSASINFQLPNSVVINIENATAAYSLKTDGLYYVVSEENVILEQVAKRPKDLISMIAPSLKSTEIGAKVEFKDKRYTKALDELTACILKNNYKKITEINIRRISDISITYDKRIKIKIGLPENIDYKLRTAFAIIEEKLDPNHTGKIKGVLNVSKCDKTKKSYFKEGSINEKEQEIITQPTTQATEASSVRTTYVPVENNDEENNENNENENDDENNNENDDGNEYDNDENNGDNNEENDDENEEEYATDPEE